MIEKFEHIIDRADKRNTFYKILYKLIAVCLSKELRIVIENPFSTLHFLHNNFLKEPSVFDSNRMLRGDFFKKPTGYWFFNCNPTNGFTLQYDKEQKIVMKQKRGKKPGLCSEERSMISPDYARNFICDFILGKKQQIGQLSLF